MWSLCENEGGLTGQSDGLLEGDLGGLKALHVDVGLSLDGHGERLVPEVPGVKVNERLERGAIDLLGDVDERDTSLGLWHIKDGEGGVGELVLEVHLGAEAFNGGWDRVAAGDAGVDRNLHRVRLGVRDADSIDGEGGGVNLALDNAGEPDEDAVSPC